MEAAGPDELWYIAPDYIASYLPTENVIAESLILSVLWKSYVRIYSIRRRFLNFLGSQRP